MIQIGGKPILWHIMKIYAHYGFNEFVIALGVKGDIIKNYFYNYTMLNNNFTVDFDSGKILYDNINKEKNWKVSLLILALIL